MFIVYNNHKEYFMPRRVFYWQIKRFANDFHDWLIRASKALTGSIRVAYLVISYFISYITLHALKHP